MDKSSVKQLLYSQPIYEALNLPSRSEILPQIQSGEIDHLDFRARVFSLGPNANHVVFAPDDMPAFAASFVGKPYLRDHEQGEIENREGIILASSMVDGDMIQDIRITTRTGMTDYVEGRMDRFSIGWNSDEVICTICNSSFRSYECPHFPGRKYATPAGEQVCELLFMNPSGRETSAVNVPAVEGTGIIMALAADKFDIVSGALKTAFDDKTRLAESAGQEPVVVEDSHDEPVQVRRDPLLRRLALVAISFIPTGELTMNVRELLSQRAAKVQEAKTLSALADAENRDFTEEERAQFSAALDEAETLGTKIETIQTERARLAKAESGPQMSGEPEKPESGSNPKLKTLAEFNALSASERMVFVKAGGTVQG